MSSVLSNPPHVGSTLANGQKMISVYDSKNGCRQQLLVPDSQVDEFMSTRKELHDKANKKQWWTLILSTLIGLGTGICYGSKEKVIKDFAISAKKSKLIHGIAGAVFGGLIGSIGACLMTPEGKEDKLTQQFIQENKK